MKRITFLRMITVLFLCINLALPPGVIAEENEEAAFRPEEIDQLMAPIALYPDALLAQVLAASTYPLEIVQAARFVEQNKDLKGEKLMQAVKDKEWDPSVKAMLQFPDVLLMMNEKLEWTQKLGDAVLGQQKDVMDSAQRLRRQAQESGNLRTTNEQKIIVEEKTMVIVIQSASPEVVYVPAYNPTVVYGAWPYPAYPPYPVYPYGYVATAALSFAAGVAIGAAWGGYGGWRCGWGQNEININNSRHDTFTRNNYNRPEHYQSKGQAWQHQPEHRGNAQYRNRETAQKYGQRRGGAGGRAGTSDARGYGRGQGAGGGGRPQTGELSRGSGGRPQTSDRSLGGGRENALSGAGRGGSERASSFRGQSSRNSASRSSGGFGGGSGGWRRGVPWRRWPRRSWRRDAVNDL